MSAASETSAASEDRLLRSLAIAAGTVILLCHLLGIAGMAGRPLHYDENEYLHASWLMASGERLYRDFFEDHPPHLFLMLQTVLPEGDLRAIDVREWAIRARLLSGAFGTLAVGAVMLFAWRMTRHPAAPVIAAATLLASSQIWSRGLTDIRAEPPTLALFWWGVVLLSWSPLPTGAQALRAGVGIGLAFFASVWNPKWPVEAGLLGLLYLHLLWTLRTRPRLLPVAIAPALLLAGLALLPLFTVTTWRDYLFFNLQMKRATVGDFMENPWIVGFFARVPLWQSASPQHQWWWIAAALAVLTLALAFRAWRPAERRLVLLALVLVVAALIELRFVYPYPFLWAQYLVMVAACAALVYAMLPGALTSMLASGNLRRTGSVRRLRRILAIGAMAVSVAVAFLPLSRLAASVGKDAPPSWTRYWEAQREMQMSLAADETVFVSPPRHPVAAFDASYYWYNFRESAPSAIRLQREYPEFLPAIGFEDLPPCRPGSARFIEAGDWMPFLGPVCRCIETGVKAQTLTPAKWLAIFESRASAPPPAEGVAWMRRTGLLWSDLCRRQEVFLRGGQLNITP